LVEEALEAEASEALGAAITNVRASGASLATATVIAAGAFWHTDAALRS